MPNTPTIYNGTVTFSSGSTPFQLYEGTGSFNADVVDTTKWCAKRLGYPIVDIELDNGQFFTCYEEAVTEYAAQVQRFQIRQNLLDQTGQVTSSLQGRSQQGGGQGLISLAETYGADAQSGGNLEYYTGSIELEKDVQIYDLSQVDTSSVLEINKIFHYRTPASKRYMDQYSDSDKGTSMVLNDFGWQNRGAGVSYMVMPIYDVLLRQQQVEFNDITRKSAYTFELLNNKLRIFPIPTKASTLYFQYTKKDDRTALIRGVDNTVSSFADINYGKMDYARINNPGLQWIRKYTLALAKELLGNVRSKYGSVPIPGAETSLDGDTLRSEAAAEKDNLITQLREDLEASSRRNMLEARKDEAEFLRDSIGNIPLNIYIG